jgi:hypothetical protein
LKRKQENDLFLQNKKIKEATKNRKTKQNKNKKLGFKHNIKLTKIEPWIGNHVPQAHSPSPRDSGMLLLFVEEKKNFYYLLLFIYLLTQLFLYLFIYFFFPPLGNHTPQVHSPLATSGVGRANLAMSKGLPVVAESDKPRSGVFLLFIFCLFCVCLIILFLFCLLYFYFRNL